MRLTQKLRWLRAVLGSVLALHLGLAQAGMAHMSMAAGAGARAGAGFASHSAATPATAPCHSMSHTLSVAGMHGMPAVTHEIAATQAADTAAVDAASGDTTAGDAAHGTQHSPCCGEGLCHCTAASGFSAACASSLIGIAPRTLAPRFVTHALSQAQPALELRPPISR